MSNRPGRPEPRDRRRRSRRHRRPDDEPLDDHRHDDVMTTEERAYRDARVLAEKKVKVTGEAIRFGVITTVLLMIFPPVGFIVMLWWGIGLGRRFYFLVVEPKLRKRFIEEEVNKQVRATLSE